MAVREAYLAIIDEHNKSSSKTNLKDLILTTLKKYFFLPNKTINTFYSKKILPLIESSKSDLLEQMQQQATAKTHPKYNWFRNPFGAKLAGNLSTLSISTKSQAEKLLALNARIKLLIGLVKYHSADKIIQLAKNGDIFFINTIDQSIPHINQNKLCYHTPTKIKADLWCIRLFD